MRLTRTLAAAGTAAVLALSLSACGGDDEGGSDEETTSAAAETSTEAPETEEPEETETETPEETEPAEGDDAAPADATPPGTELAIGDAAVVPVSYAGEDGVVEVVVTGIEEGGAEALEGVEGAEGQTAYYLTYDITGVDADGIGGLNLSLDGLTADDQPAAQLISFSGGADGCESESAPSDWDGSTYTTCNIVVSESPVTKVAFGEGDDYSLILGTPVIWS
jgi:hypothetical protein